MLRVWKLACVAVAIACLAAPGAAVAQANQRPIEDFLAAQVSPPYWWLSMSYEPYRWVRIDYNGYLSRLLVNLGGPDLGTTFEGEVTERALPDGTASVHVRLQGRNVFVFGMMGYEGESPMFGYPVAAVAAGSPPALAEILVLMDFVNPAGVGAPLPNVFEYGNYEYVERSNLLIVARAEGPIRAPFGVPNGTPGRMTAISRSLYMHGEGMPGRDYWPAEIINVAVVGQ